MTQIKASRRFKSLFLTIPEYIVFNRYALASFVAGKVREAFKTELTVQSGTENSTAKLRDVFFPFTATENAENEAYLTGCKPVEDFTNTKEEFGISVSNITVGAEFIEITIEGGLASKFNREFDVIFHTQNRDATKVEAQYMVKFASTKWRCVNNLAVKDESLQMIQFLVAAHKAGIYFELELRNFFSGQ